MLLPDETYERPCEALAVLRAYDDFLARFRIRPEFFCKHREKEVIRRRLQQVAVLSTAGSRRRQRNKPCKSVSSNSSSDTSVSQQTDASSSNEAVHLQQRLRSLSTELVTLRNRLHVGGVQPPLQACGPNGKTLPPLHIGTPAPGLPGLQPAIPPRAPPPAAATRQLPVLHQLSSSGAAPHVLAQHGTVQHHLQPTDRLQPPGSASGRLALEITEDLIHLPGPLTEDAVIKCLQARFCNKQYYTNVGPILLCVNPYTDAGNPLTLSSTRNLPASPQLNRVVHEAVRQQSETGYPQAIILSGTSGSGKTHASMLLLRQLFAVAGGGPETDAFKHLAAAFTVLRSLGSAKTTSNSESSRIGQFIEVQVTDGALYRTKIHCYFLDQTRVVRPLPGEKNYHIFYQMLAGLTSDERTKLCLDGYGPRNLHYLQRGDTRQDVAEDASRFHAWKTCLGILGIPFLDVVRVLAAVLLLGNVQFADAAEVEVRSGEHELTSAAGLLGVPAQALFHGLTSRTRRTTRAPQDAAAAGATRDSLAKALYCRTVATIVRRANSLKRLGSTLGTLSSDSNESVHNHLHNVDVASQHATSTVHSGHGGASGGHGAGAKSMVALNNAVRHATDGFIGILDMFGFEQPNGPAHLEHLCINLCAETMQHFYNTHIFKSSIESCRDEGIDCELEVDYVDNVPCIDLISSLRTGLLSMLDSECQTRGSADTYVAAVRAQHRQNTRLYEPRPPDPRHFGIRHFAGNVIYDAADFLDTNKDVVPDDLVAVFHKHTCNFGFATHLFGSELKALVSCSQAENGAPSGGGAVPARGVSFRISPTSHTDLLNGDEPVSTLTQDFHTRLDNLLRTLVHARPHFVRCIRSNAAETSDRFDRTTAVMQIRSLQVLETVNLMAGGYPHRMRFKAFHGRYRLLVSHLRKATNGDDKLIDDCQLILHVSCDSDSKPAHRTKLANRSSANVERPKPSADSLASSSWATGKRHIFLSEAMRQKLEYLRTTTRDNSATLIQATWRGWRARRRFASLGLRSATVAAGAVRRPRPQPIAGTPPPEQHVAVEHTCTLFGLDLERPPPVPPSRSYTVTGNTKLGYPQTRVMRMTYPPEGDEQTTAAVVLHKGETVTVVGASHRRGHLVVEQKHCKMHVPFQYLELNHPPVGK